jgi:hypothetical protein
MTRDIVERFKGNPILTKDDVPYPVATVHNAGMVKHNGRYVMLFRAHRRNGRSIIGLAGPFDHRIGRERGWLSFPGTARAVHGTGRGRDLCGL